MLSTEIRTDLLRLREGKLDPSGIPSFDSESAIALVTELQQKFPFVFQQRTLDGKQEIALARKVAYRLSFGKINGSLFHSVRMLPTLEGCYFISSYNDQISGVTWCRRIRVTPRSKGKKSLILAMGPGFKLDRTIDGWSMKPLRPRKTELSEKLLQERGWRFDVLPPFGTAP